MKLTQIPPSELSLICILRRAATATFAAPSAALSTK
jgi:hypothetical protein